VFVHINLFIDGQPETHASQPCKVNIIILKSTPDVYLIYLCCSNRKQTHTMYLLYVTVHLINETKLFVI